MDDVRCERRWVGDGWREARSQRCMTNLGMLREPLAGIELDTRDHAALTWLADQDVETVALIRSLFERARAAGPMCPSRSLNSF
ncbi:hypothetical protein [Saccharopolyspora rosea]|uniref:Uncharacterized protein n=1 Tax=Saccharopolyspora rosea TaxID=524884 RepID=A0ABW3FVV0_9PSEU|nr:hypothetical protein [Saccharopolyspora rosea]